MEAKHTKVYLSEDITAWLKEEARRQHSTVSAILRSLAVEAMRKSVETGDRK